MKLTFTTVADVSIHPRMVTRWSMRGFNDVLVLVGKRGYFERRQVAVDVGDEGDAHRQSAGTGGVNANYRPSREILFQP